MKERSVVFYKRVIIFSVLSIIIVAAAVLTFIVGSGLNLWNTQGNEDNSITVVGDTIPKKVEKTQMPAEVATESAVEEITKPAIIPTPEGMDKAENPENKVVYLTFDDGSSKNTSQILDILKENDVKATFFFNTGQRQTTDNIIKETYDDGHTVGVLTSTANDYTDIYSSKEKYMEDFNKSYNRICEVTGSEPTVLRFPGGSINGYDRENYQELTEAVTSRGMIYFDWNVCAEDGSIKTSKETMVTHGTKLPAKKEKCIVLMHDNGNSNTCEALKEIIRFYKDNGYYFQKLTADVEPITF